MFTNPYQNMYNQQANLDRINNQIAELQKMREQLQQTPVSQPTNLTQNFQIAPTNRETIRYANSIDEVQRDMVIGDTSFFSKDMSVVWIKNSKGEIKTYELNEIIPKDEKDLKIELLQAQIDEMRKEMKNNERNITDVVTEQNETNTTEYNDTNGTTTKKTESTGFSKISTSKKRQ